MADSVSEFEAEDIAVEAVHWMELEVEPGPERPELVVELAQGFGLAAERDEIGVELDFVTTLAPEHVVVGRLPWNKCLVLLSRR